MTETAPRTVIGVPGCWPERSALIGAIAEASEGYLLAGEQMMHVETKQSFPVEVYDRDETMREAFEVAASGRFSEEELDAIEEHTCTVYLVVEGGSVEAARRVMHAANGLLKAGGVGVKIESTGSAHRPADWTDFCEHDDLGALLAGFVTYVGGDDLFYSCGMHNLGLPDTIIEADVAPEEAAQLLHGMAVYLLTEEADLHDGEDFCLDQESARFRLNHQKCEMFPPEDLYHNPYGVWRLTPSE